MMSVEAIVNDLHLTDRQVASNIANRFGDCQPVWSDEAAISKQLKTPTSDFVIQVFVMYLKQFSVEVTGVPTLGQSEHLQYHDAYNSILPYFDMHFILSHIFKYNFINDFGISDLMNPVPKRTVAFLGLIENFTSYYELKSDEIEPRLQEIKQSLSSYMELKERKSNLREQVNNQAKDRSQRARKMAELDAKIEAKALSIKALQSKHKEVSGAVSSYEGMLHKRKNEADNLKEGNIKLNDELADLQKQVVPSPAQLSSNKHRHEQQLAELEKDVQSRIGLLQGKKSQQVLLDQLKGIQEEREKRHQEINVLQGEVMQVKQKMASVEKKKRALDKENESYREEKSKHVSQLAELNEQLVRLQLQGENILSTKDKAVQALLQEKEKMEMIRQKKVQQSSGLVDKLSGVQRELDEWEVARTEAIESMNANEEQTINKAETTITSVENALKEDLCRLKKKTEKIMKRK